MQQQNSRADWRISEVCMNVCVCVLRASVCVCMCLSVFVYTYVLCVDVFNVALHVKCTWHIITMGGIIVPSCLHDHL